MQNPQPQPTRYKAELTVKERRDAQRLFNAIKRKHKHIAGMANVLHHMGVLLVGYAEELDAAHERQARTLRIVTPPKVAGG